ncbi:MAG: MBL fold metallo-hydrolase [Arcicella sp.]|jgi:L-ascorbate metabolism protein UlaG (beta-lactamase superfamily)|nr:MBL fold metallo-hydrolase [Arcicella sp.]
MFDKPLYLLSNVVIEPLIDRWYAWSHLVSPATAALNITGRHLKIMNSFIQAPQVHEVAVKNPKMLGGPFMDIPKERVEDVKTLKEETIISRQRMLDFSEAVKELDSMLKANAHGYSLEPLYEKVPEILKGFVELVYDINGNPSFRFFESLLYKSEYYDTTAQGIAMWLTDNDERPFVLSTPRLKDKNSVYLNIPFSHSVIDVLAGMKRKPEYLSKVFDLIDIDEEDMPLFMSFFTEEAPPSYENYEGEFIRMRYFGHACVLIETKGVSILIDPIVSYYGYQTEVERFSDFDLPDEIDYVLITHNHQDHILFETLLPLRHRIKNLVIPRTNSGTLQDPNLGLMFKNIGFKNIVEIDEMDTISFDDCDIMGIPFVGEHSDLDIKTKLCYLVKIQEFSILFVADSCNIEPKLYERVHQQTGDVDVVMLGMECDGAPLSWLYGPLLMNELSREKDNSRRLAGSNYDRGMAIIDTFNPLEAYVYAMGQEPWLKFISSIKYTDDSNPIVASNKLLETCSKRGIIAERLFGEKEILYSKFKEEVFA